MMRPLLFVVNILMLKMMVRAEVVADNQAWTHKDIGKYLLEKKIRIV